MAPAMPRSWIHLPEKAKSFAKCIHLNNKSKNTANVSDYDINKTKRTN